MKIYYGILFVVLTVLSQTAVGYTIVFQDGLDFGGNCDNGETFGGNGPVKGLGLDNFREDFLSVK